MEVSLVGRGSNELTCENFVEGTVFTIVAESIQTEMLIVEYIGDGWEKVAYRPRESFNRKEI